MTDSQVQAALSDAKEIMKNYKMTIQDILLTLETYKNVDLENVDFKEDYDNMLNDISVKLTDIVNEI